MASNASHGASEHSFDVLSAMASNASQGATEHSFEVLSTSQTALTDDDFEVISQDLPASSDGYPSAATEHGLSIIRRVASSGASSDGYPSGATEHGLSITRRVASSGATEHNALLTRTMAAVFKRKNAGRHGRKQARAVLESVIACNRSVEFRSDGTPVFLDTQQGASEHVVKWSDWMTYIANLEQDVIGDTGISRITCELIENTTDPNRGQMRRCDFVVYCGDGGFWRLHPGNKGNDKTPVYFEPAVLASQVLQSTDAIEWVAAELWRKHLPIPFTREHCECVPQVDRIGKKEVWAWVQTLGALEHITEIGKDISFDWWLWLPTLVKSGHVAIGEGINSAWIRTDGHTYAQFWFLSPSNNASKVELKPRRLGVSITK